MLRAARGAARVVGQLGTSAGPAPAGDGADAAEGAAGDVLSANVYLGGFGIAAALEAGADLVVCPRVTDAALVVGPAAWKFGWGRDDYDRLAGAVVAGHIIECGTQCTGGNYAFFADDPALAARGALDRPGFPLVELAPGGSSSSRNPGAGGAVSVGTVTSQLVSDQASAQYANPDVVAHLDSLGGTAATAVWGRARPPAGAAGVRIPYSAMALPVRARSGQRRRPRAV